MARSYPVVIEKDLTGYYFVTCPILEGCYSQGKTVDEAMENIKEAIKVCIEGIEEGHIPDTNSILIGQVVL